jgi:hypothetical protein
MLIAALYFSTINAQEVWFWTVANTTYLLPIPLIFIGIYEFMNEVSIKSKIIISCTFFLIGGTLENLTIAIILSLIVYLAYTIRIRNNPHILKTTIAISSAVILPLSSVFGKGISNRIDLDYKPYKTQSINHFNSVFSDYEMHFNIPRIVIFLSIVVMIMFLANSLKPKLENISLNFKKILAVNVVLFILFVIATYLPLIKVFGNLGPARASLPFGLLICLSICFWAFTLGLYMNFKQKSFSLMNSIIASVLMIFFTTKGYVMTKKFAIAFDYRVEYIITQKDNKLNYIIVKPLPDSGVIPSQEVSKINTKVSVTSSYLGRVNGIDKNVYSN